MSPAVKALSLAFVIFMVSAESNAQSNLAINANSNQYLCNAGEQRPVTLKIIKNGRAFDVSAFYQDALLFEQRDQRPSLNVRVVDGSSETVSEFVDFNKSGLEIIPVDGKNKLEIDLTQGATFLHYADASQVLQLKCPINPGELILFLGIAPQPSVAFANTKAVAFDIDDTLMFTSPAFTRGFATGGQPKPDDDLFWTHTNGCDAGCAETTITLKDGSVKLLPANAPSTPKPKALELIRYHESLGHKVYAITARPDINGAALKSYIETQLGIKRENVFFEPDLDQPANPAGKTDRIENLDLDVFYGDSDSDITDTLKAFVDRLGVRTKTVRPVRFLRSPKSSNRKAGELNKYHPGYFGEPILAETY